MSMKIESAVNTNQILFCTEPQVSVGIIVPEELGVTEGTKQVVKAGTPIAVDLTARNTPAESGESDEETGTSAAVGVLLHDVDVTDGDNNGTLLIHGFVNMDRIDEATAAKITAGVKTALKGNVTFLK